jgi:H+/gluconate symporter-like permease
MTIGLIGIIAALIIFLILTYYGFSTFYTAAICALIVAVTNALSPLVVFTEIYVSGLESMLEALFSIIFLGTIFGKVFADTGAASSIASTLVDKFVKNREGKSRVRAAVIIMIIVEALCTMGGIDGYVLTFTMFPVALILAHTCNIPRRFIPGMLILNTAFMAAPGAPQITNVLAQAALAGAGHPVSSTAGFLPGIVGVIIILVGSYIIMLKLMFKAIDRGEVFEYGPVEPIQTNAERKLPPFILSIVPLVTVFVAYTIIGWHIAIALSLGILVNFITMQQYIERDKNVKMGGLEAIKKTLNLGSGQFPGAMIMIASPAAFAAVVQATRTFGDLSVSLMGLSISPYLLIFVIAAVIVLFTGSPPACIMMGLGMIVGVVEAKGLNVNYGLLMRIAAFTSITFESLPWNGTVLICQSLSKTNHRQSYPVYFWITVIFTTAAALAAVLISQVIG